MTIAFSMLMISIAVMIISALMADRSTINSDKYMGWCGILNMSVLAFQASILLIVICSVVKIAL